METYQKRVEEMENILYQTDAKSRSMRFKEIYDRIAAEAKAVESKEQKM